MPNDSPTEKLIRAIFGERVNRFVDYPSLVDGADSVLLAELSRQNGRHGGLSPREQRVLLLRFGFDTGKARTLEEVGREFNVTRDRIRQIEAKALRKLRHPYHSRNLRPLLYELTKDDKRAVAMRERLTEELSKLYPENLAYEITMGLKRTYLKKAIRELSRDNIARQLRKSCGLAVRYCKQCGAATLPNWDFCSPECQRDYKTLNLVCDWCGATFKRRASLTLYRLQRWKHYYCSKCCAGKAIGNRKRSKLERE
jgi:hypothetical protein